MWAIFGVPPSSTTGSVIAAENSFFLAPSPAVTVTVWLTGVAARAAEADGLPSAHPHRSFRVNVLGLDGAAVMDGLCRRRVGQPRRRGTMALMLGLGSAGQHHADRKDRDESDGCANDHEQPPCIGE